MTAPAPSMPRSISCSPKHATRRRPERESFGSEIAAIGRQLGQPFMPHQRLIAEVGGEIDPATGLPAYREVIVYIPRQEGKTTLYVSWQIHRCLSPRWTHPQRSMFTGQSGRDARDKWLDELFPLIDKSPLAKYVVRMNRGMGNEHVEWVNGSLIRLLSTSPSAGHSKTVHQSVLDEIWKDTDNRREQALRPAMSTVDDAQLLACSTAGTAESALLERKVRAGRKAVRADTGRGIAFFEYSAPDGWDPADEESYFGFMPALCPDPPCRCGVDDGGWRHTQTLDTICSERDSMEPEEFARAYGNIPTPAKKTGNRPVDPTGWALLTKPRKRKPAGAVLAFFIQVAPDSAASAIVVAYLVRGRPHVELADYRPGTSWLAKRCGQLASKHPDATWAVEAAGAVGAELPALLEEDIEPVPLSAREMGQAYEHLQQLVTDGAMTQSGDAAFVVSVQGAARRPVGEGLWVISPSRSSVDVSPLVGAAGALWTLEAHAGGEDFAFTV